MCSSDLLLPPTIVMAMVAGIFLRFGLELIDAATGSPLLALPMILIFVALSAARAWPQLLHQWLSQQ